MNEREIFIDAVRNCSDLPQAVRNAAGNALGIETSSFDKSYLEFLDEQIELNAREPEWINRLRKRRTGLADWIDVQLINGRYTIGSNVYHIKVDPNTNSVVYWENYPGNA